MAIWLLGPDPNGQCCGCEGKTSPCDSCGVDCCTTYLSHLFEFSNAESYLANDVGGCYFYPSFIESTAYVRDSINGTLNAGVLAGDTQMSSVGVTLGIGDSLTTAFSLSNGQTVNIDYNLSVTPDIPSPLYGHTLTLLSGVGPTISDQGTLVSLLGGLGAGNGTLSYTASGNGCFYLLSEISNGMINPPEVATTNISLTLSPNIVPSPMVVQYFESPDYPSFTGKYGCTECDPLAAELP